MVELVLGSASPRRAELLAQLGLTFRVLAPDIDETVAAGETARAYVRRMAREKADAALALGPGPDTLLLCADTVVVQGDRILVKPTDRTNGCETLMALSGKAHSVITAVCLAGPRQTEVFDVETIVRFRQLNPVEAEKYWDTGEPADKAGAYGIQGLGAVFVESIEGSYSNVVGLPLLETALALRGFGIDCLDARGATAERAES